MAQIVPAFVRTFAHIDSRPFGRSRVQLLRAAFGVALGMWLASAAPTANAGFHLWQVKEVFSNADGTVQFIEMFDDFTPEQFITNKTLQATSTGTKTFTFNHDIVTPPETNGRHLLIATPGFGSLPGGKTPDFTLPDPVVNGPFFNPNATTITIVFSGSGDSMVFSGASLPKDGIHSLTDAGAFGSPPGTPSISSTVNSPTNYNGDEGQVNLSTPTPTGDYNGNHLVDGADYVVWRNTLTQFVNPNGSGADGSGNGTIDGDDYTFWRSKFGNVAGGGAGLGQGSAVPEPAGGALLLIAVLAMRFGRRQLR